MPPTPPRAVTLAGPVVTLRPAALGDAEELLAAIGDPRVWAAGYGGGEGARPTDVTRMRALLETAVSAALRGERQAYVARLTTDSALGAADTVVGTSSLGEWDLVNERVHLGWTAYGPTWWGTAVNPACKVALLGHAFDDCGFNRVKIQTDRVNERSQAGIAKLGATREGVLRRHMKRADGTWRDTVVYSVLREEWPQVRAGLMARLS